MRRPSLEDAGALCARRKYNSNAICAFYHNDLQFRCYAHLFLLSRRAREDLPCPVDIPSLCLLHNAISMFRLKNQNGGDLSKDSAFSAKNLPQSWMLYQKKYNHRYVTMRSAHRTDPVTSGKELAHLSSNCALIGILENLSLGTKMSEKCTSISCALLPEKDDTGPGGPPQQFFEVYHRRNVIYKQTNLSKITSEQLANFQILVRMEIQYLFSVDVEWQAPEEGGASSLGSQDEGKADSGGKAVESAPLQLDDLSVLLTQKSSAAGSISRNEERLIRIALLASLPASLTSINGKESDAGLPSAGLTPVPSLDSAEYDIYDICGKWDYRSGHFPLTPGGLQQMKFDHEVDPRPPKYVFPAAVLLFVSTNRNEEEEACFQSLSREWDHWFDEALSYDILRKGPPKRLGLTSEESNWCQAKLEFLVRQIQSESDRASLGLPPLPKRTNRSNDSEAALLPNKHHDEERLKEKAVVGAAPRAAPAATVVGGDRIAEKESGSDAAKKVSRRRKRPDAGKGTAAKRVRQAEVMDEDTPFDDAVKTQVRPSDGKTVSLKDGRIVTAGNDLKQMYPNNYRNPENTNEFYGKKLTLSEAFKLACIVHFGPNIPIDTSGHLSTRAALFRTAAYYALTDEETKEITAHELAGDYYYFHTKSAKQLVYALLIEARLVFGDAVFGRNPPSRVLRGTSNNISVHYAETVFSNPFFSMQCIWAWKPKQPSWIARIG